MNRPPAAPRPPGTPWGQVTLVAILAGVLALGTIPLSLGSHTTNYNGLLFRGLAALVSGIAAVWATERLRRRIASREAGLLGGAVGWIAGSILALLGSMVAIAAADNLWHPPWCRDQNAAMAAGVLRAVNSGIAARTSSPDKGLPRSGTAADWESWVGPDLIPALADSSVAYRAAYRFAYTPREPPTGAYSIVARPVEYGFNGICTVYTDQTGVIRYTTEDRAATRLDRDILEERWIRLF